MHHVAAVSVLDRGADSEEQMNPPTNREITPLAIDVDGFALDVVHNQERSAVVRRPGIHEASDVGMLETCQQHPLAFESAENVLCCEAGPDDLDRHREQHTAELAPGSVDGAHAAAADLLEVIVRPDPSPEGRFHAGATNQSGSLVTDDPADGAGLLSILFEKRHDLNGELIFRGFLSEERAPFLVRELRGR